MQTRITDISQLDLSKKYTYEDYLNWWFEERVELIKGFIYKMSPAPSNKHQVISSNLHRDISYFLKKKKCKVYHAPFDVRLQSKKDNKENTTIVQPDICVICNPEIIDEKGCNGPPDTIIEILSPSSSKHDVKTKFALYQESGVKEYWIIDTIYKIVDVFVLQNGKYNLVKKYVEDEKIPVNTLESLVIDLEEIFDY